MIFDVRILIKMSNLKEKLQLDHFITISRQNLAEFKINYRYNFISKCDYSIIIINLRDQRDIKLI